MYQLYVIIEDEDRNQIAVSLNDSVTSLSSKLIQLLLIPG